MPPPPPPPPPPPLPKRANASSAPSPPPPPPPPPSPAIPVPNPPRSAPSSSPAPPPPPPRSIPSPSAPSAPAPPPPPPPPLPPASNRPSKSNPPPPPPPPPSTSAAAPPPPSSAPPPPPPPPPQLAASAAPPASAPPPPPPPPPAAAAATPPPPDVAATPPPPLKASSKQGSAKPPPQPKSHNNPPDRREGRRFGRRSHRPNQQVSDEEHRRRAALHSKSFKNRIRTGSAKADLFVKGDDLPDEQKKLPDVGKDRTEAAKIKLEKAAAGDGMSKRELRKSKKAERKANRQSSGLFAKRQSSKLGHSVSDASELERESEDPVPEDVLVEATAPEPEMDMLRTARISKRAVVLEVKHKYPQIELTPYGNSWSTDAFALIHNAIKAELRDLYSMANVMQKRRWLLTHKHVDVFYEWWIDFREFFLAALTIEEEVLFPWIGSKDNLRGSFKRSERMRVNGATRNAITHITEYQEKFLPYLPVGERLDELLELLNGFENLLAHYDAVAASLPTYLETLFKRKEKDVNAKQIVAAFRSTDGYNRNLVLLVRWMPDGSMKKWTMSNLRTGDLLSFKSWRKTILREHCDIAKIFEDLILDESDESVGAPVIGAAMAINEEMREHIDNNRVSVKSLPTSAFARVGV